MSVRCQPAFTLLEMMVAIAVLSLMMVFMFGILGQAISGWEAGGRRMESAQAAQDPVHIACSCGGYDKSL